MKNILKLLPLLTITLLFSSCGYNNMVDMQEGVDQSWANVQSAYQRRADLIPNLVNTVKGYADFEQDNTHESDRSTCKGYSNYNRSF